MITDIHCLNDNILVKIMPKNSKAGVLTINEDESNDYVFCKIVCISLEAFDNISKQFPKFSKDDILVVRRVARASFINDFYFISWKDVRAAMSVTTFEEL